METPEQTATPNAKEAGAGIMASYGLGRFIIELLNGAFAAVVFKFYETEIHLAALLLTVAIVIHSVWNAITYPLVGYLTSRPTRLSAKWGRRFPWILFAAPLGILSFVTVFAVPAGGSPALLFAWLLLFSCLYDLFNALWELNYLSIFPDKFRSFGVRNRAAGIGTLVGTFGVVGGSILPGLFIVYGVGSTYLTSALVIAAIGLVAAVFLIPGVRETPDMIRRFLSQLERDKEVKRKSFVVQLKEAFTHRNFVAFILFYFFYQAAVNTMQASIYYVADNVLGGKKTTLIFAAMLLGALGSLPIWHRIAARSKSNQKSMFYAGLGLALFSFPMTFVSDYVGLVVCIFLWGIAFGGVWFLLNPAMADVVDDIVLKTGRRDDGLFYGFRSFFGRLSVVVQALSFWIIHEATGFATNPNSPQALLGIHIHLALLPAILILVGALLYKRLTTLTPEICAANKEALHQKGL